MKFPYVLKIAVNVKYVPLSNSGIEENSNYCANWSYIIVLQIFLAVPWTTSYVHGNHLPQMTAFALRGLDCFAKSVPCFLSGCFGSGLDCSSNDCYKNSICQTEELMLMDLCQKQLTWLS